MPKLSDYKQTTFEDIEDLIAAAEADHVVGAIQDSGPEVKPKARCLTKKDGHTAALVSVFSGEHIEPRRW